MEATVQNLIERLRGLSREQLLSLEPEERARIESLLLQARNEEIDKKCAKDPLWWAQNLTATENPHYLNDGLPFRAPFPKKGYFVPLFQAFADEPYLLIPKSREMMTSWCAMVHATCRAQWYQAEVVVQTQKEEKARRLVEYAAILYRNQADWLKSKHPLKTDATALRIEWADGGKLYGVPGGPDQIRMFHPTMVIFDEAAFMPDFGECWSTAFPVAKQMIAISSAAPSTFGDWCSEENRFTV